MVDRVDFPLEHKASAVQHLSWLRELSEDPEVTKLDAKKATQILEMDVESHLFAQRGLRDKVETSPVTTKYKSIQIMNTRILTEVITVVTNGEFRSTAESPVWSHVTMISRAAKTAEPWAKMHRLAERPVFEVKEASHVILCVQ